jgi:hypothetical protein
MSLVIVFLLAPVILTVARILHPSQSARMIDARLATLNLFMGGSLT